MLLAITALAGVLNLSPDVSTVEVRRLIDLLLPPHIEGPAEPIHSLLDELLRVNSAVGFWSAIGFVWFSTRLFGSLRSALADVFDVEAKRGIVAGKLFDIRLTITCTILLLAYVMLNLYLSIATSRGVRFLEELGMRRDLMGGVEYALGRLLAFCVVLATFYGLYRYLPVRRIHSGAAAIGALAASVAFELARYSYEWYTTSFGPATVYGGTLYAIVSVVFWVYFAAIIFLLGGEVARVHEVRLEAGERRESAER